MRPQLANGGAAKSPETCADEHAAIRARATGMPESDRLDYGSSSSRPAVAMAMISDRPASARTCSSSRSRNVYIDIDDCMRQALDSAAEVIDAVASPAR